MTTTTTTRSEQNRRRLPSSSYYPLHPEGSQWLARVSETDYTVLDRLLVGGSSLVIVGSVVWVPALLAWAYRRWKRLGNNDNDDNNRIRQKKTLYAALLLGVVVAYAGWAPHRHGRVGRWLGVRKWKLWQAWVRFLAIEILLDQPKNNHNNNNKMDEGKQRGRRIDVKDEKAILAFCPHGIFPFAFGGAALTELGNRVFGTFRPVVASAVQHVPVLADLVGWMDGIDARRSTVRRALGRGDRLGLVPGGIDEMFTGYPRPGCHPDEEYAIVRRGFLRMALRYQRPVVPVYCFGSTKLFRRLQLPRALERLSHLLRMSLVAFYGVWGLPIPFRQRLTYIVGDPINVPPSSSSSLSAADGRTEDEQVEALYQEFCNELKRLFERHKEAYGWGHKTLQLLSK